MNNNDLIMASLKRRKRAEKRFRLVSLSALLFSGFALIWLVLSVAIPATSGFMINHVRLDFAANIAPENAQIAVRKSFLQDVERREKRMIIKLLAPHAHNFVPINAPAASVDVPLSSRADLWLKDNSSIRLLPEQEQALQKMRESGLIHQRFNWRFFSDNDSRSPEKAGFYAAIIGSFYLVMLCLVVSLPIGIFAAIYLEEFAPKNRFTDIIEININNLAAVPSIIYGLLGLFVYLHFMNLPRSSALAGGLTLALMTLPIIIISTRITLKSLPSSMRNAALAIGASPLQVVFHHLVPQAMGGIITGTILALARAIGETAPLLMIGMVAFIINAPDSLLDPTTAMPVQIYIWSSSPEAGFANKTASGIMVLISILLCFNILVNLIRNKSERKYSA